MPTRRISAEIRINVLNTNPIRAEKIFGPALIDFLGMWKISLNFLDKKANGLYFDNSNARNKKSRSRKAMNMRFEVAKYDARRITVKAAFPLATFSLMRL